MTIERIIKHIIEQHDKHPHHRSATDHQSMVSDIIEYHNHQRPKYWHRKLEELEHSNPEVAALLAEMNDPHHHLGDYYIKFGMKIDTHSTSPEAEHLRKVTDLITKSLKEIDDQDFNDEEGAKVINVNQPQITQDFTDQDNVLLEFHMAGNKKRKPRNTYAFDSLDEHLIKVLAVSILAETNGNSKLAEDVLKIAGLKIIKSMNKQELHNLSGSLKSTSALPEMNYNTQYDEHSR